MATSRFAQSRGLIGLVIGGGLVLVVWLLATNDSAPGFASILDFKIMLSTFVMILSVVQVITAAIIYGWVKVEPRTADLAAAIHRWNGRVVIVPAVLVAYYCLKDVGPQSNPTRVAIHTALGSMVFVILAAKLIILRAAPRLSPLVPVFGVIVALAFIGLWATSSLAALRKEVFTSTDRVERPALVRALPIGGASERLVLPG